MNLGILILGMLIFGVEPLIVGLLLPHHSITTILPGIGLANIALILIYAIRWQYSHTLTNEHSNKKSYTSTNHIFFPAFVFLTLTIDAYLIALPNVYGYIAMLVGAIVFFGAIVSGYHTIQPNNLYWGKRKIMPKDYVFWIGLVITSCVWFMLGSMRWTFKTMVALWILFFLMLIIIRGMNLIKKNSIWKLLSVRITLILALMATVISAFHTYMLITDNRANFTDLPTLLYTGMHDIITLDEGPEVPKVVVGTSALMTGTVLSGFVDVSTGNNTTLSGSALLSGGDNENIIEVIEPTAAEELDAIIEEADPIFAAVPDGQLSYRSVLNYLVRRNELTVLRNSPTRFDNVRMSDPDYQVFNIAAQRRMIGKNITPDANVSCQTYIVLKGLAEGRDVTVTDSPFGPYWQAAESRNEINGCTWNAIVTKQNL